MNFFAELKRRNVFKVAASYAIVAWIVLQVVATTSPALNIPSWVLSFVTVLLLLGLPVALVLAWAFELTPDGIKATRDVTPEDSVRGRNSHKFNYVIIGGLAVLLGVVMLDNYVLEDAAALQAPTAAGLPLEGLAATPPAALEKTVAVLPFENLSGDAAQEYLSDGVTEELLNKLAQVPELQVAGRTSSFFYKDRNGQSLREIGQALGVNYILDGSVRKVDDQIRVGAQLIQASDGFLLWSATLDRRLDDIFALQNEIAQAVTQALQVRLGVGEFDRPGMTTNVEAYDAYLLGLSAMQREGVENAYSAIEHLNRAVMLDPAFGLAWAALADTSIVVGITLEQNEVDDLANLRESARMRAAELAPDMPELALIDATTVYWNGDWLDADRKFQALLQDEGTSSARANYAYAQFLRTAGRASDALPYFVRARRLDPQSAQVALEIGLTLLALGRAEEAMPEADRGLQINNAFINVFLGAVKMMAAYEMGDRQLALRYVEEGGAPPGAEFPRMIRLLAEGDAAGVRSEIDQLLSTQPTAIESAAIVIPAVLIGEPQLAYDGFFGNDLERVVGPAGSMGALPVWAPSVSPLRQLPDFKQHVIDIGLADYWRTTSEWGDFCRPVNDDFECE